MAKPIFAPLSRTWLQNEHVTEVAKPWKKQNEPALVRHIHPAPMGKESKHLIAAKGNRKLLPVEQGTPPLE
jgi:hypothetical protein